MELIFCMTLFLKETFPSILPPMVGMHPSEPHELPWIPTVCGLLAGKYFPLSCLYLHVGHSNIGIFFRCIWQITAPNYTAVFIFRFQYNVSLGDVPFQLRLKDLNRAGTNSTRMPRVHGQIGLDKAMMMIFFFFLLQLFYW